MPLLKTQVKARDVMTPEPVCVSPSTTIRELARLFRDNEVSSAPVVDQQGQLVGIASKTDLVRRCAEGIGEVPPGYLFEVLAEQGDEEEFGPSAAEPVVCVEDFMTEDPYTVSPETPAADVARLMFDRRIHRVIVVDQQKYPVGIITSLDLLGALTD